jgi:flavin reductase (DIM6/NTAB) family NADH-FMN oxidoreductase RutF
MQKISIDEKAYPYPMPVVLLGTMVEGRPNFMTVGWVARVNFHPPLIAVAVNKSHYTNSGIHESRAFSVNIPGTDLLEKVDYCGLVSGRDTDKSSLFTVVRGEKTGAPLIDECPLSMECKLTNVWDLPTNELFVGEIVGAYADPDRCTAGKPDITKIKPFTLTMPDNHYWEVGANAGKAWSIGRELMKKPA